MESVPYRSKLEQLPTELIQAILSSLSDILSLRSAALSCRYLHDCMKANETQITKVLLVKHLNPALIHDAVAAHESSQQDKWSQKEIIQFLPRYVDPQQSLRPSGGTLSEALTQVQLYNHVRFWSTHLASKAFAQHPLSEQPPLSWSERTRIERALYRFEIYCNLFGQNHFDGLVYEKKLFPAFFGQFSPCENEQLACIYDFFIDIVSPVLQEVVEDDPDWVYYFALRCKRVDRRSMEHQLSLGLVSLAPFVTADTREARRAFLSDEARRNFHPYFLSQGLTHQSWDISKAHSDQNWTLSSSEDSENEESKDFIREQKERSLRRFIVDDTNPGPEAVWRWGNRDDDLLVYLFSPRQASLRKWAYVMWDQERLDAWGIFDGTWDGEEEEPWREKKDRKSREYRLILNRGRKMFQQGVMGWRWRDVDGLNKTLHLEQQIRIKNGDPWLTPTPRKKT